MLVAALSYACTWQQHGSSEPEAEGCWCCVSRLMLYHLAALRCYCMQRDAHQHPCQPAQPPGSNAAAAAGAAGAAGSARQPAEHWRVAGDAVCGGSHTGNAAAAQVSCLKCYSLLPCNGLAQIVESSGLGTMQVGCMLQCKPGTSVCQPVSERAYVLRAAAASSLGCTAWQHGTLSWAATPCQLARCCTRRCTC